MCLCKEKGEAMSILNISARNFQAPLDIQTQWYAVQTRSNFEQLVTKELTFKGIENYCPLFEELHQWADRKKVVQRPVLPGYVFARFTDVGSTRQIVQQTNGAVRILGCSQNLEAVPDCEISSLQRLVKSGQSYFPHPFLQKGEMFRVKRGLLKNVEGRLVRIKNRTNLVLSVNLLSNSIAVEVDTMNVEAIQPNFVS